MSKRSLIATLFFLVSLHAHAQETKLQVFVSIPPLLELVSALLPDSEIKSILPPGQNAETYTLSPSQFTAVVSADIVILLGLPYEYAWQQKLTHKPSGPLVIEADKHIKKRTLENHSHGHNHDHHQHHTDDADPHIWLSVGALKQIAKQIAESLPERIQTEATANENLELINNQLSAFEQYGKSLFSACDTKTFFAYHGAWAYLADDYGLTQIAIEHEGKSPSPKHLQRVSKAIREHQPRGVIIQQQTPVSVVKPLLNRLQLTAVPLNPLDSRYLSNYTSMLDKFSGLLACGTQP